MASALFCHSCGVLQPPPADYFGIFGIEPRLRLDKKELEGVFYSLSRRLHPDLYSRKSAREQQYSLDATAVLNDAWRTLRDPIARAEYVMRTNGLPIGEQGTKNVPPELLEEVFELNMALEELKMGDDDARGALDSAAPKFRGMLGEIDQDLEREFTAWDDTHSREALEQIRLTLNRRRYIQNLVREVERALSAPQPQ